MKLFNCLVALAAATFVSITCAQESKTMELGNFSVSLAVKDIKASLAFYEKRAFKPVGGSSNRTGSFCRTAPPRSACSRACLRRTS